MADKLTLRGVKRIESYTEPADVSTRAVSIKRPITGKDQFTLKRWWKDNDPKRYVNVTALDITRTGGNVVLAVVSDQDTRLEIKFTDPNSFVFGEIHSVERLALFSPDFATLYIDYTIPKVPGVALKENVVNALPS